MPPSAIVIVRHGERADHMDPEFGKTYPRPHDPPLTASGVGMAEKLGEFLRNKCEVDPSNTVILTSPLLRCVQTSDGLIRGLLHASHADNGSIPLFLEPSLAEGAYWLFRDMQNNPSLRTPQGFAFPQPIFRDAAYYHDNVSKYVKTAKPFDLKADPVHCFDNDVMTEPDFHARVQNGAGALLSEPALDGKVVVLVAHGETTLLWCQAVSQYEDPDLPASPPYTAVTYLARNNEGQWRSQGFKPFTTPHLAAPPSEN